MSIIPLSEDWDSTLIGLNCMSKYKGVEIGFSYKFIVVNLG